MHYWFYKNQLSSSQTLKMSTQMSTFVQWKQFSFVLLALPMNYNCIITWSIGAIIWGPVHIVHLSLFLLRYTCEMNTTMRYEFNNMLIIEVAVCARLFWDMFWMFYHHYFKTQTMTSVINKVEQLSESLQQKLNVTGQSFCTGLHNIVHVYLWRGHGVYFEEQNIR